MGYNHALEEKRFKAKWRAYCEKLSAAGMDEEAIQSIYEFEREVFNGNRRYETKTVPLGGAAYGDDTDVNSGNDSRSSLLRKHMEQLSNRQPEISVWGRYAWVEDLDKPELAEYIKSLPEESVELLTCMVVDKLSRADLSRKMGVSRAAITKRINVIKKILEKLYPRG